MLRDLRFGLRMLLKQPGFTLIAIVTLALGIGATAAVFSLIEGVLLTPPPYRDPERIVVIPSARSDGQPNARERGWAPLQWQAWQKEAQSFESIAAYGWSFNFLILPDGSESLEGMAVTREYFPTVGLEPVLGRTFLESELGPNAPPVIILGYDFWQRKYNGDPNVLGQIVRLSRWRTPPTVIGVMPPGVRFLPSPTTAQEPNYNVNALVDFWTPASPNPEGLRRAGWNVVGRLRSGVTLEQAQAELSVLTERQARSEHDFEGIVPDAQLLTDEANRDGRGILLPMLGAAVLVLLIGCGNAAALLLVRGLQRQQEYAVRSALGVTRAVLFRQVSMESLLLALFGGSFGIALAFGIVKVFKLIGTHAIPRLDAVTTGWPILAFGFAAAMAAALLAGIFPALRASRLDPMAVLKNAGPKSSAARGERQLLRGVAMAQTALTLVLLVGAGLLIRTMMNLSQVQSGYDTSHILTMSVTAVDGKWDDFHHRALERVSALAGVEHAAFAWGVPLTGNNWPVTLEIEGQPPPAKESDRITLPLRAITPDYFELMRLSIVEGRNVRSSDVRDAAKVAVVNQAFADRYFPGGSALGKKLWGEGRDKPAHEIVGVVSNARTDDLTHESKPEIYASFWQHGAFSKHLVVRTTADPRTMMATVQRELRAVDPTVAVENIKTMDEIRGDSLASRNFAMQLLIGFAVVASVLTLVGIYGVLSLSVASRRREIAIRAAMGAERRDIRKLVFAEGFRLIAGGVILGVAGALVLSRVLASFLFEVEPTDPLTFVGVGLLFVAVALLACWEPTRRAVKVDPLEALRYE